MWSREELRWVAGYLEGEGSFCIAKRKNSTGIYISCNSTDVDPLVLLVAYTHMGYLTGPHETGHKPKWTWRVQNSRHAYALMVALYPFMGQRRRASIAAALNALTPSQRKPLTDRVTGEQRHGTHYTYQQGCRCETCRAFKKRYHRDRPPRNRALEAFKRSFT